MANDDLIARLKDEATYHEAEYAADLASDHGQIADLLNEAATALSGMEGVRVKPLVWRKAQGFAVQTYRAETLFGDYFADDRDAWFDNQVIGSGERISDTKAIVFAHYTTRILSALELYSGETK